MLRGIYSESPYGQMRDRIAEREKKEKQQEEFKKKGQRVPYRTLLAFY